MPAPPGTRAHRTAWQRLRAIAVGGVVCSIAILAVGRLGTRLVLGSDLDTARQRVQAETQALFNRLSEAVRTDAIALRSPDDVERAAGGDVDALRRLFDRAAAALTDDAQDARALSVYSAAGQPIAWSGRPSELPSDRLQGAEAWFLAQGAVGLRLIYVVPVSSADGRRVGTAVAERALDLAPPGSTAGEFVLATTATPVGLELAYESGRTVPEPGRFDITDLARSRLAVGTVADADLARTNRRWTRAADSAALMAAAIAVLLLCGPILTWQRRTASVGSLAVALVACAVCLIVGRILLRVTSPADYSSAEVFSGAAYASPLIAPLLSSPFDFFISALAAAGLLALVLTLVETVRTRRWFHRLDASTPLRIAALVAGHAIAGVLALGIFLVHRGFVRDTISNTALDLLQFSLHPWDTARLALQVGMVIWHGVAVGLAVAVLRAASAPWRLPRRSLAWRLPIAALWVAPWLVWFVTQGPDDARLPVLAPVLTSAFVASAVSVMMSRFRHGSQAFRLLVIALMTTVPALACYPVVFTLVSTAKREQVETRYAPQAINQRQTIQRLLQESLSQIDSLPLLAELVRAEPQSDDAEVSTERAFQLWRMTGLAGYPITSSVELFGPDTRLVSRFAFNLPDDLTTAPRADEDQCSWTLYEEVSPFFAEERRVLHAGRAICPADAPRDPTKAVGAIVVHAMLDYANLPFIASQSPYVELLRPGGAVRDESLSGRDLEYAVYGWSGRPFYSSVGTAWELSPETLRQVASSRMPRWQTLERGDERYRVYLLNDRGGIYALGFPMLSTLGHLVNLAEVTVLASVATVLFLFITLALDVARGRATSGRALLREIRASFYRKLFLAFVAASVVPVVILAVLTRNYIAGELRDNVEEEAVRTASAARRVVEDLAIPRSATQRLAIDDNLMVWVSRLIDQDVNVYRGTRLQATSERNLFASGVLAMRTPADVYRALVIQRDATAIVTDRVGTLTYLVAATPLATRQFDGMLTVPLTLRQQDIEDQIDTLNRLVLLGALLFILAGAGLGYSLAERIADPVNRLTRATRRIARGELDVRIAATSSDELRRLVQDFNRMAEDLQNQRAELERTHRLEAWAEMARQVAHEIKNPLTPIQLNAEHLRRVHQDRGRPMSPMLEDCVSNILTQVSLLRTIASEFSNFASSPVVHRAPTALSDLVAGIVHPYAMALQGKVSFAVDVAPDLPRVLIDRTLVARAFTNIVENALHAMPDGGTLTITADAVDAGVRLRVTDSGVGMDADALARAFEPYFSTKMSGTGLGLPIARRNIELTGGAIDISSARNQGTTVELTLPVDR